MKVDDQLIVVDLDARTGSMAQESSKPRELETTGL